RACADAATLAHSLGAPTGWALEREQAAHGWGAARPTGQRVFQRDVIVDGQEPTAGTIILALQLTDLHFAPSAPLARPIERFAGELEFRVRAEVDLAAGVRLVRITGAERRRGRAALAPAPGGARDGLLPSPTGVRLRPGATGER